MNYRLHKKKLTRGKNKRYNFQHQKDAAHVREMDPKLGLALIDALTVEETVE